MIAAILKELRKPLSIEQVKPPKSAEGEKIIHLRYAALNKRDDWIARGAYPGITLPLIPGSDGTGFLPDSEARVFFNPGINWGDNPAFQAKDFTITGLPDQGTLAQQISVPENQIYKVPDYLTDAEAAALPLAGVTAYRALFTRGGLRAGESVLISGIGGGVASMAVKFALAAGAVVYVNSSSDEKIREVESWGVRAGWNYRDHPDWTKQCIADTGGMDLVIDSAGGDTIADYVDILKPGGRLVFYGATLGPWKEVPAAKIYYRQLDIRGTTMGSNDDFRSMLGFVTGHEIRPQVEAVFPLEEVNRAFERLNDPTSLGKIVVKIPRS